jgi:cellulose synthase/poly-beta-1,6-N-acetylglucosamine synthase-like glycosyltransferase
MSVVEEIAVIVSLAVFLYLAAYALLTFGLILLSLFETALIKVERGEEFRPPRRLRRPGITLVAPTYQNQPVIVPSARSFLASDYDPFEVVIVDDGSADGTLATLRNAFDLIELPVGDRFAIVTEPITGIYVSRRDPRLRVVRKDNGGRSDAINAGTNVARNDLVALVDADSLLEPDALSRIAEVFVAAPDDVVAVGGTIRVANGAVVERGAVISARISKAGVEASQAGEYLRGHLGGRIGWSRLNGLLVISGAFGVFRCDILRAAGGLSRDTLGEDMELVLRLHHELRPGRPRTRIAHAADANVWTEVPAALRPLRGQRIRWHVGLIDNVRLHRRMVCRRRYGAVGLLSLPYTVAFELLGPILQVAGYAIVVLLLVLGLASWWYAASFLIVAILVGQLQTAGAILIEEVGFRRYRTRDLMLLAGWSVAELLWYRPLTAVWRLWATVLVVFGRRPGWGTIPRGVALHDEDAAELMPAPLPR